MIDRRTMLGAGMAAGALAAVPAFGQRAAGRQFPQGFLWGASTAGHQVEGNDTASDTWFLENIQPTVFAEPAGDAANSFALWEADLDLARGMGLNAYRFSVEWSRIEPERGLVSQAMLDHYARIVEGCHQRGLAPIVTFNHFTNPRWFAARGGWLDGDSPQLFAEQCSRVAKAMGDGISHALTFNEPNLPKILGVVGLPAEIHERERAMLERASQLSGGGRFVASNVVLAEDIPQLEQGMLRGHELARTAIKAERGDLPVGVSLALMDDHAGPGGEAMQRRMREHLYGAWLRAARSDDFIGVQNYERAIWGPEGRLPPPADAASGHLGSEVYPPSLAGAVRHAHSIAGVPVLVTEHGVGAEDDKVRATLIPGALSHLHEAIAEGVPVIGYCHWSLLDNFEWIFGYGPKFGLASVDRTTFVRTPKPSSVVYEAIARSNAL